MQQCLSVRPAGEMHSLARGHTSLWQFRTRAVRSIPSDRFA